MIHSLSRRALLQAAAATAAAALFAPLAAASPANRPDPINLLAELERASGGRLGLCAHNAADGALLRYRADERFPLCSTCKVMAVAAVLRKSMDRPGLLRQRVRYTKKGLVSHSPVTERHVTDGLDIAALCAATLERSDSTALNLLLRSLGGPGAVTAFARSMGDTAFRLDRREPELNSAIPGDERDSSTPAAMERSLRRLVLGDALAPRQRELLWRWMRDCTTGAERIRAAAPQGWTVGNRSGSGDYGTTNDIAVLLPPDRPPVCVAVYFTQPAQDAPARGEVVAAAARILTAAWF